MKIFLVRHGIASEYLSGSMRSDAERPLTPEGKEETLLVARGLKKAGLKANLLITSPLLRAQQTAELFAQELNYQKEAVICKYLAPGGAPKELIDFLKAHNEDSVALFGHEPDMGYLAQYMLGTNEDINTPFKKAGACRIDFANLSDGQNGILKWFIPPKISKLLAKI